MFVRKIMLVSVLLITSCAKNQPPQMAALGAQVAYVGARFELEVSATDLDGDPISYGYSCENIKLSDRARLAKVGGSAVFSWTPIAADVGEHQCTFTASDGIGSNSTSVIIAVRPGTGPEAGPIFRKPLGDGTTLDLSVSTSLSLEVLVEDTGAVDVEVTQDPSIPGSSLKMDGFSGTFTWTPTAAQAIEQRFVLHLVADDHDNPPVLKDFTILILAKLDPGCPGQAPTIQHTPPASLTTQDDIHVTATVTDDKGLKSAPVVHYTKTQPENPAKLDYSQLSPIIMTSEPGVGVFGAYLPNPAKGLAAGESATIYYVIMAEDDDDSAGNCDHRTQAPAANVFKVTVTQPASSCSVDGKCQPGEVCAGNTCVSDNCTPTDSNGDGFFREQASCPTKHFCPSKGPGNAPSHCAANCTYDDDCDLPGYVCKVFDTRRGCGLAGGKALGAGCSSFTECSDIAMCLPWVGGYCAISDCDSSGTFSGPCPDGSACIPMPDSRFTLTGLHWLCLRTCTSGGGECRTSEGYSCKTVKDDNDVSQQVCIP